MIYRLAYMVLASILLAGCLASFSTLENASENYKLNKNYASLEAIYRTFTKGMLRQEVETLLGDPDYSPIDGQYYYSSDHSEYSEDQQRDIGVGLVVDYRDSDGNVTDRLQDFWLGSIAE
jgi:outer membrane protein assembly factor BamE (lipoprotein component of BamABCDE complex)